MILPERGYSISRQVMNKRGPSQNVTFHFPDTKLATAKLLADMQKWNLEQANGLHSGTAPYSKSDFEAVITGVATPVGNLLPIS